MNKPLEAAKAFLKSLVGKSEEEVSDVLRESGLAELLGSAGSEEQEADSDTDSPEEPEEDTEEADKGSEDTPDATKAEPDSGTAKADDDTEELEKSDDSEADEVVVKAVEELTAEVVAIKSKVDELSTNDNSEELESFIKTALQTFNKLNDRISSLEESVTKGNGATYEQGEDPMRDKSLDSGEKGSSKNFWVR